MKTCLLCEATSAGTAVSFRRRDICNWCEDELARAGMAWCAMGRHKVTAVEMATGKPRCRACERARPANQKSRSAYAQAWRAENAERFKAVNAAYRKAHREESRAYKRSYYRRNLEVSRQQSRERYLRYRDQKLLARKRRYWQDPVAWRQDAKLRAVRKKLRILRGEL